MAQTPSKRFEEMVEKVSFRLVMGGPDLVSADMASTLLSRQHASFVRLVKKLPRTLCSTQRGGLYEAVSLDDILAALQQGGKK